MFKGRSKGRFTQGMDGSDYVVMKVPLKGLFSNKTWKCNCDPRLEARHLQTRKTGINYGRWFRRCPRSRPNDCDFFLWDDDAKLREEAASLNDSRTEPPLSAPHTPAKVYVEGLMTPETIVDRSSGKFQNSETTLTPYTPSKSSGTPLRSSAPTLPQKNGDNEENFSSCAASDEKEAFQTMSHVCNRTMPPPETPRKAVKTDMGSTPGKRDYDEIAHNRTTPAKKPFPATPLKDDDVFTTASTATTPRAPNLFTNAQLPSPADTPTALRFHDLSPGSNKDSDLATEILDSLASHHISPISPELREGIRAIGNRHSLQMHGVTKGRDVSRAAIAGKDETIAKLQGDIAALQSERDTYKIVIGVLKRELESEKEKGGK